MNKGDMLKDYFSHDRQHMTDVTFDMSTNKTTILRGRADT
jgi:hypothetical protein